MEPGGPSAKEQGQALLALLGVSGGTGAPPAAQPVSSVTPVAKPVVTISTSAPDPPQPPEAGMWGDLQAPSSALAPPAGGVYGNTAPMVPLPAAAPMMVVPPELAPLVNELMAQAQVPLSAASLEGVDEAQRDSLLGERLYALLSATHAAPQAGKITGMLP